MAFPRRLPDNSVLQDLRRQGWTYDQIAQRYGVSRGAVYLRLREANAVKERPDYSHLIPWTVATKHDNAFPLLMLRNLGRRQSGAELPPVKARMLDKWLAEVKEADVVVCYHPDYPPNPASRDAGGFYYSRRKPTDGDSLTRVDEGTPIRPVRT